MKKTFYPHILTAVAMLFLVMSCGITDPNIESARLALIQADYEEVIASAEDAIEANPDNPDAYYYLGVAYASMASEQDPEDRLENYEKAREHFDTARRLYDEQEISNDEAENLPEIIVETWGWEHNSGIEPLTDDILSSEEDSLQLARHHLNNATTINPDSVQSFNLLAEVQFALGDLEAAEETTRHVIYEMERGDLFNYYRLAHYMMETDRDREAIAVLQEAREQFPDEIEVIQEIANAYLRLGETDEAMEVVGELIERDPENPQYRLVYATQIYQLVQDIDDEIRDMQDEIYDLSREVRQIAQEPGATEEDIQDQLAELERLESEVEGMIEQSFTLSEDAENELMTALDMNPDNPDIHFTLGIVYQNRAAVYQGLRNMADDMEQAEEYDNTAREYLEEALPYYERAAELDPDDVEYWRSLFRVYTNLGMEEEAQEARERAGL